MTILKLKFGDRVRNINKGSKRLGCQGIVYDVSYHSDPGLRAREYHVIYDNGIKHSYAAHVAHFYLELIATLPPSSKLDYATNYRDASMMARAGHNTIPRGMFNIYGLQCPGNRKVLRRERVNVITGKTQSQMVKELGHARGVAEFNTRATGRTTGIAFSIIGQAMCNPGQAISYQDVDHTFHEGREVRTPYQFNKNFESELLYKLRDLKGFVINPDRRTIQYNPIVTEEVYV